MHEDKNDPDARLNRRRRFLRDSVRGSVPLLLGLASEPAADEPEVDSASARRTSPPPEIEHTAPEPTKEALDKLQEDFARDNPGLTRYRSE